MSNQFYNFIAEIIYDYFKSHVPLSGERYYLTLNNYVDIHSLKTSLDQCVDTVPFQYNLENGDIYSTIQIPYNDGADLVVSNASNDVTNDFLVTLRNRVGDQVESWKGKALLSVITDELDSISGGSISLQSEGMPLHPKELSKSIKTKIQEQLSDSTDRIVLSNYLSQIDEERLVQFTTFYDYREVIEIAYNGRLSSDDYKNLGMFKDEQLSNSKGKNLEGRLNKNKELYSKIEKLNELNQDDSEYERFFLDRDIPKIKKEDWRELDFSTVYHSNKKRMEITKGTKVSFERISVPSNVKCDYFIRPLSNKGAGKRKYQLLIYTDEPDRMSLSLNMDVKNSKFDGLQKDFLKQHGSSSELKVRKRAIDVSFDMEEQSALYEKLVYKHEGKASLGAEFHICVIPFSELIFKEYHTSFEVDFKGRRLKLPFDSNEVTIGTQAEREEKVAEDQTSLELSTSEGNVFELANEILDREERVTFDVQFKNVSMKIELAGEKPETVPVRANKLAKVKRESQVTFDMKGNKITSDQTHDFYVYNEHKTFLDLEKQWVEEIAYTGVFSGGQFDIDEDIKLPAELKNAYNRFVNSFLKQPPSLISWSDSIQDRAIEYVEQYIEAIKKIDDAQPAGKKSRSLFKLGVIDNQNGDEVWLTPFHPLSVAFELRKLNRLSNEEIDQAILDRLKPDGLLPYLYDENDSVFTPDTKQNIPGWILYKKIDTANVVDADLYLDKVVKNKLQQFEEHFSYLFMQNSLAPIKVNIINVLNDYQAIRGLIKWYLDRRGKNRKVKMPPIHVNVYRELIEDSYCEHFAEINRVEDFERIFEVKLKPQDQNETAEDQLEELHENINFFVTTGSLSYDYAHISFYKMEAQKQFASQPMDQLESGVSMDGLYTTVPSKKFEEDYRSGFGVKDYTVDSKDLLLNCAYYTNELASNMVNQASNTYVKGRGIVARTTLDDLNVIHNILQSSNWVTFVDPGVELDFFESTIDDLLVIHYNDQYSSSSRYDAITVTSRSNQYYEVIKEFFDSLNISTADNPRAVERTISAFNTINGEWLLKIIGNRGHFTEEKLSIIAAIKMSLAYFNHENILWVPVSLEEVLRVAGAVNLNQKDGIFTAKNLGVSGKHSDDVLLIGIEQKEDDIHVHLYPIEVKIGNNYDHVIKKAHEQIEKTSHLLERETIDKDDSFMKEFYQNFFIQLFTSNAKRMTQTSFFTSKDYSLSSQMMEKLKKGQYKFVNNLSPYIGEGAIISYKRGIYVRTNELKQNALLIEMSKEDDLKPCMMNEVEELEEWLTGSSTDFVKENIFKYSYSSDVGVTTVAEENTVLGDIYKLLND
ncbi:DNA phosphorothioation-dependent restriction protein DptH [Halobacillus salinus]|uniref:DNA phosphorothioation-dependent restriction protein DptH n=1 Tax=Halobacillus salinus TaxID=192814 RepID=UPI0015913EA4|nr:DNA phosphorothioation-dependent restriction protein DptH [Halobacillus salinus]